MFPVEKSDSGFLQRFLWAFPADSKKKCINQIDLGPFFLNNYNEWFRTYYEIYKPILFDSGQPKAKIYKFSPEALKIFLEWNKENTDKVNAAGDSLLSEEYNKFDIHFLRFALIMQIMEDLTGRHYFAIHKMLNFDHCPAEITTNYLASGYAAASLIDWASM